MVLISYVEDLLHLKEVVDTLCVKLMLELVSNLIEAVFPVHICFLVVLFLLNKRER
jgi:hypothetical protein